MNSKFHLTHSLLTQYDLSLFSQRQSWYTMQLGNWRKTQTTIIINSSSTPPTPQLVLIQQLPRTLLKWIVSCFCSSISQQPVLHTWILNFLKVTLINCTCKTSTSKCDIINNTEHDFTSTLKWATQSLHRNIFLVSVSVAHYSSQSKSNPCLGEVCWFPMHSIHILLPVHGMHVAFMQTRALMDVSTQL